VTSTESLTPERQSVPADAIVDRLNDPAVAASLVTLLDHAELLSTLVIGLGGFIERGDTIMDAVAEGVNELKASRPEGSSAPNLAYLAALAGKVSDAAPTLEAALDSSMVSPEMIDDLALMSDALTEGITNAQANQTAVKGVRGAMKSLKDPEVQRGLGMLIEVARSLGRRMDQST
jgi:hypothetical protein